MTLSVLSSFIMRSAILSDIHGNLEALTAVMRELKGMAIDQYYCLGDVIGYGANPRECLKTIKELTQILVMGNHEWAVLGHDDLSSWSEAAREALLWTRRQLLVEDLEYLSGLPFYQKTEHFAMTHGAYPNPEEFVYLEDLATARRMMACAPHSLMFIGHTHIPLIIQGRPGEELFVSRGRVVTVPDTQYIINVGSVGQPRDGNPLASFAVYDTQQRTVEIHRIAYDIAIAQEKIRQAGLPRMLADRLKMGY
jgi:diadenosine tetraphosphatase ApaH/serine/threonine PP2A family protein phosphatase